MATLLKSPVHFCAKVTKGFQRGSKQLGWYVSVSAVCIAPPGAALSLPEYIKVCICVVRVGLNDGHVHMPPTPTLGHLHTRTYTRAPLRCKYQADSQLGEHNCSCCTARDDGNRHLLWMVCYRGTNRRQFNLQSSSKRWL